MLKIICPKCEKQTLPDVINVLPKRRYEIKCTRCGTGFVVDAEELDRQEKDKLPNRPNNQYNLPD
jgi:hypothetical protein